MLMMVAAFFLGSAAVLVGVYWLIGRDIDRAMKHKDARRKVCEEESRRAGS